MKEQYDTQYSTQTIISLVARQCGIVQRLIKNNKHDTDVHLYWGVELYPRGISCYTDDLVTAPNIQSYLPNLLSILSIYTSGSLLDYKNYKNYMSTEYIGDEGYSMLTNNTQIMSELETLSLISRLIELVKGDRKAEEFVNILPTEIDNRLDREGRLIPPSIYLENLNKVQHPFISTPEIQYYLLPNRLILGVIDKEYIAIMNWNGTCIYFKPINLDIYHPDNYLLEVFNLTPFSLYYTLEREIAPHLNPEAYLINYFNKVEDTVIKEEGHGIINKLANCYPLYRLNNP
jgi:hypothetical protein